MGILARLSIFFGITLAVLAVAGVGYQTIGAARDAARFPAPGRIVEIDGRDVHVQCSGAGSPGVALEAGAGLWSTHWRGVQPAVAQYTQVCSYDRPGLGWSEPVDEPRSRARMADQLRSTLRAVAGEPPWVLVGHSLGGLTALHLAAAHPDEVAGLVLVDSAHPGWDLRVSTETLEATNALQRFDDWLDFLVQVGIARAAAGRLPMDEIFGDVPPEIRERSLALVLREGYFDTLASEWSLPRRESVPDLGAVPLIVITRGLHDWTPDLDEDLDGLWLEAQRDLATASTRSRQRIATESTHMVPFDQPEIIVEAIRELVDAARRR